MLRIKSAMLSLCLCECGPHSPIATLFTGAQITKSLNVILLSQMPCVSPWLNLDSALFLVLKYIFHLYMYVLPV